MSNRQALVYLTFMASIAGALAILTVLLAVAVDPYWMWNMHPVSGLTAMKPRVFHHYVLSKTYLLERQTPKTLLLGNSRVEVGLDPDSPMWPEAAKPVFNAALSAYDLSASLAMLRETFATHAPETIIVGVDFPDFLSTAEGPPKTDQSEAEARLPIGADGKPNPKRSWQVWKDRFATTLNVDALLDSLLTLTDQRPAASATMMRNGFNPHNPYRVFAARSGYHVIFAEKNADYVAQYAKFALPDFSDLYNNAEFRYLVEIVHLAAERNTRLIVYIHPYHREYLDLLSDKGSWNAFENWKRALVRVSRREAGDKRNLMQVWDFSGYNPITTEPVPAAGDTRTRMQWYWESGHYKSELGERLIARMMGGHSDFGREVTEDNVESVLAEIREERSRLTGSVIPVSKRSTDR
jgi:hypothetical protein